MECEVNSIRFMDADICDQKLLFYDATLKGFLEYHFDSGKMTYLEVDNKNELDVTLPRKVLRKGNNLYFIESEHCIINILSQSDNGLRFEKRISAGEFDGGVKNAYLFNGEIWIFPMRIDSSFVIFNTENMTFRYHRLNMTIQQEGSFRDICVSEGVLYITTENSETLYLYDMRDDSLNMYPTGINKGIEGIAIRDGNVILREKRGKSIYSLDITTGKTRLIAKSDKDYEELGRLRVLSDGTIIICPIDEKNFFYVDEKSGDIKDIRQPESFDTLDNATFTIETGLYNDKLYVYPWASDCLMCIQKEREDLKIDKLVFKMDQQLYADYVYKNRQNNMISEQKNFTLADFMERL